MYCIHCGNYLEPNQSCDCTKKESPFSDTFTGGSPLNTLQERQFRLVRDFLHSPIFLLGTFLFSIGIVTQVIWSIQEHMLYLELLPVITMLGLWLIYGSASKEDSMIQPLGLEILAGLMLGYMIILTIFSGIFLSAMLGIGFFSSRTYISDDTIDFINHFDTFELYAILFLCLFSALIYLIFMSMFLLLRSNLITMANALQQKNNLRPMSKFPMIVLVFFSTLQLIQGLYQLFFWKTTSSYLSRFFDLFHIDLKIQKASVFITTFGSIPAAVGLLLLSIGLLSLKQKYNDNNRG